MLTRDMEKDWMESRGINTSIEWTEQEKKWLEEREERFAIHGIYSNPQIIPSYWQTFALTPDYKDAAEFEARVAKALAGPIHLTPCNEMDCEYVSISCPSCRLKHARLEAEYKMEAERC